MGGFFPGVFTLCCSTCCRVSPITWVNHHLVLGGQHPGSLDFRQTSQVKLTGKFIPYIRELRGTEPQKKTVPDLGIVSNKVTLSSRNTWLTSFWTALSTWTLLCLFVGNHLSGEASSTFSSRTKIAEGAKWWKFANLPYWVTFQTPVA